MLSLQKKYNAALIHKEYNDQIHWCPSVYYDYDIKIMINIRGELFDKIIEEFTRRALWQDDRGFVKVKMWPLEHNSDEKECDPEEDGNAEKNVDEKNTKL